MDINEIDLTAFRRVWARRSEAAEGIRRRTHPQGMTRPARDAEEREFLRRTGQESLFDEIEMPGFRTWRAGRRPREDMR